MGGGSENESTRPLRRGERSLVNKVILPAFLGGAIFGGAVGHVLTNEYNGATEQNTEQVEPRAVSVRKGENADTAYIRMENGTLYVCPGFDFNMGKPDANPHYGSCKPLTGEQTLN